MFQRRLVNFPEVKRFRMENLRRAAGRFFRRREPRRAGDFAAFCFREKNWFRRLRAFHGAGRTRWRRQRQSLAGLACSLAQRKTKALAEARDAPTNVISGASANGAFYPVGEAAPYANRKGIEIVGDMPIFVSRTVPTSGPTRPRSANGHPRA